MCSARALRRRNDVSSFAAFGLNCPRLVFQAHRFPCFSKALPPQKFALPLFPIPGFVAISFRHNSLLCERITSMIPGPTCTKEIRRPSAHLQNSDGSQKLYTYTFAATGVSVPYSSPVWSKVLIPINTENPQVVDEQLCTPVAIWRSQSQRPHPAHDSFLYTFSCCVGGASAA